MTNNSGNSYLIDCEQRFNSFSSETNKTNVDKHGEVWTPDWLIDEMLNKVKITPNSSVLDLCSGYGQFAIRLLRKLSDADPNFDPIDFVKNKLYFVESQPSSCEKIKTIFNFPNLFEGDAREVLGIHNIRFDFIIGNPPYTRGMDLKILYSLLQNDVGKEYLIVHPSTWILDRKGKKKLYNQLKQILNNKLRSVKFFNGNPVFNVGLFVPCMITHIDMNYSGDTDCEFFGEKWVATNIYDITKFGASWLTIVKPFYEKISKAIETTGHVWEHNIKKIEDAPPKLYVQLGALRGHETYDSSMFQDDFYTMVLNNPDDNKQIKQYNLNMSGNHPPTFIFYSELERDNFLSYLNTDFARFCLAYYKKGKGIGNGEMRLIPWLDFTTSWDDTKLFTHFQIDQKTQEYIRSFLPDYYSIRPKQYCQLGRIRGDVVQLTQIRGHVSNKDTQITDDDFYTLVCKDKNINKGIRKPLKATNDDMTTFEFISPEETDNFLNYLNTDFARFCLAIYKNGQNVTRGELSIIPWLDFTQSWNDEKLFAHFQIDTKTQAFIRSYLPNYYNIDRNV